MNPRKNKEASVVDDPMKVFLALLRGPTDKPIAGFEAPSGGSEAHGCK